MDDLGNLLAAEQAARSRATAEPNLRGMYAGLRRRAKRRRTVRAVGASALGVVIMAGVGVGAYGLVLKANEPEPAASPSVPFTAEPEPSYLPVPEPLPYQTPDRTLGAALPQKPWVTDEVWAQVTDDWELAFVSVGRADIAVGGATVPKALYLVSPEGDAYAVRELTGAEMAIERWRINAREVVLRAYDPSSSEGEELRITLNLITGATTTEQMGEWLPVFVETAADGREAWYVYATIASEDPFVEMYDPATRTWDRSDVGGYSALDQLAPSDCWWPLSLAAFPRTGNSSAGVWTGTKAGCGFSTWDVTGE